MHHTSGSCHCGNISFEISTSIEPFAYNPRACDCEFCRKHNASYLSDRNGALLIEIKNKLMLNKYKVGSGIADFLVCNKCGVMVGVCYELQGNIYGAINTNAVNQDVQYGEEVVISPRLLTDIERIDRWKNIWFNNVQVEYGNA